MKVFAYTMKTYSKKEGTCTETLKLLADFWTLSIIKALHDCDEIRFCELQRALDMVNPVTLTNRLLKLEEKNLVLRRTGSVDELSVTYSLTYLGKEAYKVVKALDSFAEKMH